MVNHLYCYQAHLKLGNDEMPAHEAHLVRPSQFCIFPRVTSFVHHLLNNFGSDNARKLKNVRTVINGSTLAKLALRFTRPPFSCSNSWLTYHASISSRMFYLWQVDLRGGKNVHVVLTFSGDGFVSSCENSVLW